VTTSTSPGKQTQPGARQALLRNETRQAIVTPAGPVNLVRGKQQ